MTRVMSVDLPASGQRPTEWPLLTLAALAALAAQTGMALEPD